LVVVFISHWKLKVDPEDQRAELIAIELVLNSETPIEEEAEASDSRQIHLQNVPFLCLLVGRDKRARSPVGVFSQGVRRLARLGFRPRPRAKRFSIVYSGHSLIWHALYLHVAIECGMIGIGLLAWFLLAVVVRSIKCARITGEFVPLLGIVSFMVVGCAIPAIDGASGLFLDCGLLSFETSRLFTTRSAQRPELRTVTGIASGSGRYLGTAG
jgi:hypothetical protein